MTRKAWSMACVGVLGLSVSIVAAQGAKPNDDDLALVKRAVAQNAAPAAPQAEGPAAERAASRSPEPRWFKVRVVDKLTGKKKVTVNMPLSLVRALGDEMPVDWPCGEGRRIHSTVRMSEVLAALESGQDLVEVDDEDSEVRVWVE
jgi:hypothetical protein